MRAIPLHDLDEVATKRDLAVLRADLAVLRAELGAEIRADVHTEIASFRESMDKKFDRLVYAMIAMPLAILGGVFGLLRYAG